MILSFNSQVLLFVALLGSQQAPISDAFAPAWQSSQTQSFTSTTAPISPFTNTQLSSSTGSGDGSVDDDDEISKLIGKRSQIKRKKKEELPTEAPLPDDVQDFDLENLPEFKTARPSRAKKKEDVEAEEAAEAAARRKEDDTILSIDYLSEHDDENDFHIPNRLGFSTVGWGDPTKGFVPEGKLTKRMIKAGKYVPGDCQMVYNKLMEGGISLIETSPAYGKASRGIGLSAEEILAQAMAGYEADANVPLVVESLSSSKYLPPFPSAMRKSVEQSCERLKIDTVDIVQVYKRVPLLSRLLSNGLMQVMESGSCNYVGVMGILQRSSLQRFCDTIENKGEATVISNAFEFSLTNGKNEAMIQHCKDMGVIPLILNPLDGGLASGVYTATNPSGGNVQGTAKFTFAQLEKLQPLHSIQETVAERARTRVARELRDMQDRFRSRYGPPVRFVLSCVACVRYMYYCCFPRFLSRRNISTRVYVQLLTRRLLSLLLSCLPFFLRHRTHHAIIL